MTITIINDKLIILVASSQLRAFTTLRLDNFTSLQPTFHI